MRLTPALKTVAAIVATAVLGVSAASAFVGPSAQSPAPPSPVALPGSEQIGQIAQDPGPGLPWAVRSYVSTSGSSCVEAGRMENGRFGQVDAGQVFRETPAEQAGSCADLAEDPVLLAINHYPAGEQRAPRTVLFGQARADVTDVAVSGPGGPERLLRGVTGAFILPLAGTLAPTELPVQVTLLDGRRLTFDWR